MDTENTPHPEDVWEPPAPSARPQDEPPARPVGYRTAAKIAALVAAGLLVGGGVVFAAVHKSGSGSGSNAAAGSTANSAARGGTQGLQGGPPGAGGGGIAGEQHIQGTLTAKTSGSITARSTSGTATYVVNATTEIVRNGQSATLSAVEVGDAVVVHVYPSSSGQMLVERLFAGTSANGSGFGPPGTGTPPSSGAGPTTGSPA
jgi:hypothetical protein